MTVRNGRSGSDVAESPKRSNQSPPGVQCTSFSSRAPSRPPFVARQRRCAGMRNTSRNHLRQETPGLLPQIIIHITRRFQAECLLGDLQSFINA